MFGEMAAESQLSFADVKEATSETQARIREGAPDPLPHLEGLLGPLAGYEGGSIWIGVTSRTVVGENIWGEGGITLKVAEMLENEELGAEAGGVNGKDQGNSILAPSQGRRSESRTTGLRGDVGVGSHLRQKWGKYAY